MTPLPQTLFRRFLYSLFYFSLITGSLLFTTSNSQAIEVTANLNPNQANQTIDDSVESRWTSGTRQQAGQTFTINLLSQQSLERLEMVTSSGNVSEFDYPRSYEVRLSNDDENYGPIVASGEGSPSGTTVVEFDSQQAQFIQITQTGSDSFYWWSIHDLKVVTNTSNQAPNVSFVPPTPQDGSTIDADQPFVIKINASDQDGSISNASLFVDETLVSEKNTVPYEWPSESEAALSTLSAGRHEFKAQVEDNFGAITTVITHLLLSKEEPPTPAPDGAFIAPTPANNGTLAVGETVYVEVAADGNNTSNIRLYINDQLVRQENVSPYQWSSNRDGQLANLSAGQYVLRADIRGSNGAVRQITSRFTIGSSGPVNSPPTVSFASPSPNNGATIPAGSDIVITANASDIDGNLQSVSLSLNNDLINTDTQPPFSWSAENYPELSSLGAGNYTLKLVAKDSDNVTREAMRTFRVGEVIADDDGVEHIYPKTVGADKNPMKGWNSGWSDDRQEATVGFQYIDWKDFEPNNNEFSKGAVENIINRSGSRDRHLILRLYCDWDGNDGNATSARGCPDWIYKQVGVNRLRGSNGKYVTDYNDPKYLAQAEEAIAALGSMYNDDPRIYAIQVGILGYWGEWHTFGSNINGSSYQISTDSERRILNAYRAAFPNKKLMARYPYRSILRDTNDIGFHNDFFRPNNGHSAEFDEAVEEGRRWLDGPIGGEVPPGLSSGDYNALYQTAQGRQIIERGRYSTMKPGSVSGANLQSHLSLHKRFGYQYQINSARFAEQIDRSDNIAVKVNLENTGIAPFYYQWQLQFALLDANNQIVATQSDGSIDLRSQNPRDQFTAESNLSTGNLASGNYQVAFRIIQPDADQSKNQRWKLEPRFTYIEFANQIDVIQGQWSNDNRLIGGWSILGSVQIN